MATIINNPSTGSDDSGGVGVIVGILVAVLVVGLFVLYVFPTLRGAPAKPTTEIKIDVPAIPAVPAKTTN